VVVFKVKLLKFKTTETKEKLNRILEAFKKVKKKKA